MKSLKKVYYFTHISVYVHIHIYLYVRSLNEVMPLELTTFPYPRAIDHLIKSSSVVVDWGSPRDPPK